jgi:hypothetical protein
MAKPNITQMTQALALLERLHAWERSMGGWENLVWRDLDILPSHRPDSS